MMANRHPLSILRPGAGVALILGVGLSACEPSNPADGSHRVVVAEAAPAAPPVPGVTEAPAPSPEVAPPVEAAAEPEAVAPTAPPAKAPPTVQIAAPPAPAAQPVKATVQPGVLPQGAGRNVAQRLCGTCHSLILVTANGHTEAEWDSIVARMESNGMQASADDINTVIDYLSKALPPR
jgi:cytochrome c5